MSGAVFTGIKSQWQLWAAVSAADYKEKEKENRHGSFIKIQRHYGSKCECTVR